MKYCPQCASELQDKLIDGVGRRACPSSGCGFVHWNNPVPVVAGLVRHDGRYILARNAQWPEGMFSVITGFLEKGETPESAVLRETREELGVCGKSVEFIGHFALPEFNQLIIAFAVDADGKPGPGDEIVEIRTLSRSELETHDFGHLELTKTIVSRWLQKLGRP